MLLQSYGLGTHFTEPDGAMMLEAAVLLGPHQQKTTTLSAKKPRTSGHR